MIEPDQFDEKLAGGGSGQTSCWVARVARCKFKVWRFCKRKERDPRRHTSMSKRLFNYPPQGTQTNSPNPPITRIMRRPSARRDGAGSISCRDRKIALDHEPLTGRATRRVVEKRNVYGQQHIHAADQSNGHGSSLHSPFSEIS